MKRIISVLLILIFCFALSSDAKMLGMVAKKKSAAVCKNDTPSYLATTFEAYSDGGATVTIDTVEWTQVGTDVEPANGAVVLNDDSCGTKNLTYTNAYYANYLERTLDTDNEKVYITGWIKVSDAVGALGSSNDCAVPIRITDGTNNCASLIVRNVGGVMYWQALYYDNGSQYAGTVAYADGASKYFKMFYDDANNDVVVSIGADPENQTDLINNLDIVTTCNPRILRIGMPSSNSMDSGEVDVVIDSLAVDETGYKRVEYKQ